MIIVGDIGNTETKICLISSKNKIVKRISLNTKKINFLLLKKSLSKFNIKSYPTTNLFDLTNVKITSNNATLMLIKIYEKFIPIFSKFNVKNIDKI